MSTQPDTKCTTLVKSGTRAGERCGCSGYVLNPFTKEWSCKRHNKLSETDIDRLRSDVLCHYYGGLRLADDIDAATAVLPPDPIGDENIKWLKGYINVKIEGPILYESLPLVFMSKLQGYGEHFDRASLAKCLKSTLEYIFTRPDYYVWQDGVSIETIYLMRIRYSTYYGKFIAEFELR